jgi:hypothetical protein
MLSIAEKFSAESAAREARMPKIVSLAQSVDSMVKAVERLAESHAPVDTVRDMVALVLSEWCKLRYKMCKLGGHLHGNNTPFPDVDGLEYISHDYDFPSGRYVYAYAIGYYTPKSSEFKPLCSGWDILGGVPRGWTLNIVNDVHRFQMDARGRVASYKCQWKTQNMYIVGDIPQIAKRYNLAEGKYVMRTCVYILPYADSPTAAPASESACQQ